jgi:hypothetical protein
VRLRSRLAACDRLRVFSRALSFGICSPLDGAFLKCLLTSYALELPKSPELPKNHHRRLRGMEKNQNVNTKETKEGKDLPELR